MTVRITINNVITLENISNAFSDWLIESLTFPNPMYEEALKYNRSTWNIPNSIKMFKLLPNGIQIPRGMLQLIEEVAVNSEKSVELRDNRVLVPTSFDSNIVLRDYQIPAKDQILSHPNGLLVAPAGSGKTIMGLNLCAITNQKTLWITHTKRLAAQVKDRILGNKNNVGAFNNIDDKDIGLLGGGKWKIGEQFTVGIVQTLVRNLDKLSEIGKEFGMVIVDEVHHSPSSTFMKVLKYFSSYYMYGLTATPIRRDKLEKIMIVNIGNINAVIDREVVKNANGIITPNIVVREINTTFSENNDYNEILNEVIIPDEHRQNIIVCDVLKEASMNHHCIVISTRKEYCELLFKKIKALWNKSGIATGDYSDRHNDEQVQLLEDRIINVLVTTVDLLGEGFDVKHLDRGFFALPVKWEGRVEQVVGRIQRTCDGQDNALLYDYRDINVGILENQFKHRSGAYAALGAKIINV